MKVRKAVLPVAGLGTRFLPATKAMPKEMLPLLDKPLIQYVVEEAVASGIEQIIFVTGRSKRPIEDHFDKDYRLETQLQESGKTELLKMVRDITDMVEIAYVRQKEALGLGHAVLTAKNLVGNEPFAVMLGDDIIRTPSTPGIGQLVEQFNRYQASVLAVEKVPMQQISSYGCVAASEIAPRTFKVSDMVEKPPVAEAPSDLAIIGRYILTPEIFPILEQTRAGRGGEIQLTDAIKALGHQQDIYAYLFEGKRYDCGDKLEYLKATVELALMHPEFGEPLGEFIRSLKL
ncbi:UTP-glucose-1-phosphate uridylyltransferase [Desulfurispirillum indicum S5]|uniref:UTP--glucose-1-phosphate uridylyltransferase n=1 Tax=Desulfurispirillum indicum (strain ATCC BAA-1389 / DSM 22839 / S5) TaxID=653733 RepID=E6W6J6_DESIS|nr:UTP--glucose-1-phosphate uridylyltransferase GalU [Desulfurispirillum indicum]ADU64996.1 UTP-glucose-1-phosphate uridylyltransferase [Desulfurispirillum indicum S5]